jgi:D-xylose transport system substrate-binding protein
MFRTRKVAALVSVVAVLASATTACSSGGASGCKVGVSWNNYQEERWAKWDEPAIKKALEADGAVYMSNDAKSSSDTQAANVDALVNQGAKVVIILAQDGTAIKPAVAKAVNAGAKVISYDRLIEDANAFYITFDNVLVGKLEAEGVLAVKNEGNFVIIKGNKADANADFIREGMTQAGIPPVGGTDPTGKIKIVGESYTENWDPAIAKTNMEQFLKANNNKVDAVVASNDGTSGGVISALKDQGMAGTVPVSGQDGDAAALNRIALGTQTVDVWKDARLLGEAAGKAAVALCGGTALDKISTPEGAAKPFVTPVDKVTVQSILITPQAITNKNFKVVLDANWIDKATLCKDVPAGKVDVCG